MRLSNAYKKFVEEHAAFLSTRIYLLRAHLMSSKVDGSDFSTAHMQLMGVIGTRYANPHDYVLARLFIAHVSAFELFLQDIASCVIRLHPKKAGAVAFKLSDILDAGSSGELVQRAIEELLNKIMYKKPLEYLEELAEILSIDKARLTVDWLVFIEAKARRDLGVHNDWICNSIYLRKLNEAGIQPTMVMGQTALPVNDPYIANVPNSLFQLASDMYRAVATKYPELEIED